MGAMKREGERERERARERETEWERERERERERQRDKLDWVEEIQDLSRCSYKCIFIILSKEIF